MNLSTLSDTSSANAVDFKSDNEIQIENDVGGSHLFLTKTEKIVQKMN